MTLTEAVIGDWLAEADDLAVDELVASGTGLATLRWLMAGRNKYTIRLKCLYADAPVLRTYLRTNIRLEGLCALQSITLAKDLLFGNVVHPQSTPNLSVSLAKYL